MERALAARSVVVTSKSEPTSNKTRPNNKIDTASIMILKFEMFYIDLLN
jgi:hypothetical protein